MQLIIKSTSRCNFNCTFCSARNLHIKDSDIVDDKIKKVIKKIKPNSIIITGGDPLCANLKWYIDLLGFMPNYTISLTTNLYDFYLHPTNWIDLFNNPRVGVTTSFQIGGGRQINGRNYDIHFFKEVMYKFENLIGYMPPFISVIESSNEKYYLDNILLAKELGTKCRLNGILPMGICKEYYPRYKLFNLWFDIIDRGLDKYELNTYERQYGRCNLNTGKFNCEDNLRVCWIDDKDQLHLDNCEDRMNTNIILKEKLIKDECKVCPLCRVCNNCRFQRELNRNDEKYCLEMKKLWPKIRDYGFII